MPDTKQGVVTKGLEVGRGFFENWGLPYLERECPDLADRAAAFICGGSQSLGNDDELSRDHAWGPHFDLVLTNEDMKRYGRKLEKQINAAAPRNWRGHSYRGHTKSIPVASIDRWFKNFVGASRPPKTDRSWLRNIVEDYLYMLRHATVFHDPLGEFSARQSAFHYYPDRVWHHRIVQVTFKVWHHGQYNFLDRMTRRQDKVAVAVCIGHFIENVMRLCMLLGRDYTPYWKWLAAEFRKLPDVAQIDSWLLALSSSQDIRSQATLIRDISSELHRRLVAEFELNSDPKEHPHPLFCAKNELASRIGGEW